MELRNLIRRLAGIGLVAGACVSVHTALLAQDNSVPLPRIESATNKTPTRLPAEATPAPVPVPIEAKPANLVPGAVPHAAPQAAPLTEMPLTAVPHDALPGAPVTKPATPAPAPATTPATPGCGSSACADYWAKVPPIQATPRTGWFPIPPGGEGYYSVSDEVHGNWRKGPPKYPYPRFSIMPPSFFDVDWRYLDKPDNKDHDFFDCIKRVRLFDDCALFTSGGELRARYSYEENSRLANVGRLAGRENHYDQYRARVYGDLMITNRVRLYGEFITAISPNSTLIPQFVERNYADFQNLFIDIAACDVCDSPLWVRVGRQELLYGSQRLVSTLDWVNNRRTFQGIKAFWQSEKVDIDAFCVQPIPSRDQLATLSNRNEFDSVDNNRIFAGLWTTFKPRKGEAIDAYYLLLDDTSPIFVGNRGVRGPQTVHTFGGRWVGDKSNWLWDVEGMVQAGEYSNQGIFAKAGATGVGYHFKDCWGTPIVWAYYDYASGDPNPGTGNVRRTFDQLFPFGHYYFGFIDVVGRRNINDFSMIATIWPVKWMFTQLQVHNFYLDQPRDALYNAGGVAIRRDPTGNAGSNVGTEFDLLVNFHIDNHSDILFSYSYLAAGSFLTRTAINDSARDNPQAFYIQYSYRW